MRISQRILWVSLALSGGALAQSPASVQGGAANLALGTEMSATLSRPVDSRRAKPGDDVTATLAQDVKANGQVVLHRGTTLIGRVTEAQPRVRHLMSGEAHADARLGILFERAVLTGGRQVAVNAMIQAVASTEAVAATNARGFDSGAPRAGAPGASAGAVGGVNGAGRLWSGSRGVFGIPGVEITATSAGGVHGQGSVLTSRAGDVALERGTQLLLATSARATSGAEGGADVRAGARGPSER